MKTVSGRTILLCFELRHASAFSPTYGREIGLNRGRRLVCEPPLSPLGWRAPLMGLIAAGFVMAGVASGASLSRSPVTFNRDVLPILVKNCQGCHSLGRIAPMPFTTYEETWPWAAAIRTVVVNKKMPPWISESHPGLFGDDGRLSQAEIDTIVQWVQWGAPEGSAQDAKNGRRGK